MQHKTYLLESFCFSLVVFFPCAEGHNQNC